ncbi:MAG TPA: adenylate/guanylate cyclase domain-containing protein [Actinocatenispora sp.]
MRHESLPSGLVTFLFTDIEGSTRLARALGPAYRAVLADHRRLMRTCLRDFGGAELLTEGDSFFAVFADASAAIRACVRAQRSLAAHPWPEPAARPHVRMGLHSGYAEPTDGEYASVEVHRAARVAAAAAGDQVLCSAATARLVGPDGLVDLGLHRLRGFDDRMRIFQVTADGLPRDFPRVHTLDGRCHNLPEPLTRFVGRAAEQLDLAMLLTGHRLVTVWGAGGVGKTRLAVQVGRDLVDGARHPDGVWFVDLAAAPDADPAAALADTLGVRQGAGQSTTDAVIEYLLGRECLLLLDTCEPRRAAVAALLSALLAACPGVTVLATSRVPLGIPGELVWRLAPSTAVAGALLTDRLGDAVGPAARRVGAAVLGGLPVGRPGVRSTASGADRLNGRSTAAGVDRLARSLAGLPLAVELAVPKLRVLPPGLLADRLTAPGADPAALLAGPAAVATGGPVPARHASLWASLDWSYRLVERPAARLLRSLAAWPGRFDLAAVEWLAAEWLDPSAACSALAELVDASLVEAELTDESVGYRLPDPVRWATRRLAVETGDLAAARARYQSWRPAWVPAPRTVGEPVAAH